MITYTLMPDYGGSYGWLIEGAPESHGGVGSRCAPSEMRKHGIVMPRKLSRLLEAWQSEFESAPFNGYVELDWPRFHARGIALAKLIKRVIRDRGRVIYEKPCEDPDRHYRERQEILTDGSVIVQASRTALYLQRHGNYYERSTHEFTC